MVRDVRRRPFPLHFVATVFQRIVYGITLDRYYKEILNGAYDFGIVHETLLHDLGCTQLSTTDEDVYVGSVLGED